MEEIIIIAICLIFNAFLAAFEMAFVSVSRSALRQASKEGSKDADRILERRESPERTLSVIQIGITLVASLAAAVGGVGAAENIQPFFMEAWGLSDLASEILSVVLIVIPLTYLNVVLGELTPKSLALRSPMSIVLKGTPIITLADRLLSPVVTALEWSTKAVLDIFFKRSKIKKKYQPETSIDIDKLAPTHQKAVVNLAHIERQRIKDILLPWENVTRVRISDNMEEVVKVAFASGHTRLPVVEEGQVIGILHTKEFLAFRENGLKDWERIVRPVIRVRENDTALSVLKLMQKQRSHMATVYSSGREILGIITLEDITEEIFGDIFDEDENSRIRQIFAGRVKSKGRLRE